MNFRQHLPLILLVAWELLDAGVMVTFLTLEGTGRRGVPWDPIFLALISAQGSAALAWLYLGRDWAGWHIASLLGMIACLSVCGPQPELMVVMMVIHLFVLAVVNYPLAALHDYGWRYRFHLALPEERKPWQFSLRGLVEFTSVIALCLGLWVLLGTLVPGKFVSNAAQLFLYFGLSVWPPAIRVLAGIVESRYLIAGWTVVGVVHLRLLTLFFAFTGRQGAVFYTAIVVAALVLIVQTVALRWAGWRIERDLRRTGRLSPKAVDSADATVAAGNSRTASP